LYHFECILSVENTTNKHNKYVNKKKSSIFKMSVSEYFLLEARVFCNKVILVSTLKQDNGGQFN